MSVHPTASRQPVHTVYVPGTDFTATTVREWGDRAIAALDADGPLPGFDLDVETAVRDKLAREPIEDLRIDFEDGYRGVDEDADVVAAAEAVTKTEQLPTSWGVRVKGFEPRTRERSERTLTLLVTTLAAAGGIPAGFRFTLAKVSSADEVVAMTRCCVTLEDRFGIDRLVFELQIELPVAVLGPDGRSPIPAMIAATDGRCAGLHFGTYDYTGALGIAPDWQSLDHPVADYAKSVMQVAAAASGTVVSDGSTNILPVGDTGAVRAAWELHARLVRRSLERGIYQGWDLHPAQLPTRFAANLVFFRESAPAVAARLRRYVADQQSGVLDEPATARAMANFLLRGVSVGAPPPEAFGLDTAELRRLR